MGKRKLSKQQRGRVNKRRFCQPEEANGLVVAHHGRQIIVEHDGESLLCSKSGSVPPVVAGDKVLLELDNNEGSIVALAERRQLLTRPDWRGEKRPVAANLDQLVVIVAPSPPTPVNLIDRYLVAAHTSQLQPIIVLNKSDLLTDDSPYHEYLAEYQALGYATQVVSANSEEGIEQIRAILGNHSSILVGQSGVGKSSITKALLPEQEIDIANISQATGKGRHTTTTSRYYHLASGGSLIDSPGIREFGLWHLDEQDVYNGFLEIQQESAYCKFRDCTHRNEPGCAVLQAVEEDRILIRRLDSLHGIIQSLTEVDMRHDPSQLN
ncbi:ribosome small subunit-dependent GTPase A [Salinibius halmophilus]|uniref:ribosome small subunit-dependent GTPase A n=1 Tax=Salinibius halmophilus TaxID=1853216 RepID=UPI000E6644E1|nr:ribosome small subunit-dependent GTPase A [Salinibius halmophilus]